MNNIDKIGHLILIDDRLIEIDGLFQKYDTLYTYYDQLISIQVNNFVVTTKEQSFDPIFDAKFIKKKIFSMVFRFFIS